MKVETIAEQMFFSTFPISCVGGTGETWTGTGFAVGVVTKNGRLPICVTNRHVLENAATVELGIHVGNPDGSWKQGSRHDVRITDFGRSWHSHPEDSIDIAAFPLGPALNNVITARGGAFFRLIQEDLFLLEGQEEELDALETVRFVGYPSGLFDQVNQTPIVRTGSTATPIALDYGGLPAFLIDASVFPASSGSPVFLHDRGMYSPRTGGTVVGTRFKLLGIVAAVHQRRVVGSLIELPTASAPVTSEAIDLGIVYKARAIRETINELLAALNTTRTETSEEEPPADQTQQPSAEV